MNNMRGQMASTNDQSHDIEVRNENSSRNRMVSFNEEVGRSNSNPSTVSQAVSSIVTSPEKTCDKTYGIHSTPASWRASLQMDY